MDGEVRVANSRKTKRRLRYSLRTALATVAVASLPLWFYVSQIQDYRSEQFACRFLRDAHLADCHFAEEPYSSETANPKWDPAQLRSFRLFRPIDSIEINYGPLDRKFADALREFKWLRRLTLYDKRTEPIDFSNLNRLQELNIERGISPDELFSLSDLNSLQVLCLNDCDLNDSNLRLLKGHRTLRKLELAGNTLTSGALTTLSTMSRLEYLDISGNPIDPTDLHQLSSLSLKALVVDGIPMNDDCVIRLCQEHPELRMLSLCGTEVSDSCISALAMHPNLQLLVLIGANISDEAFSAFANSPTLNEITLLPQGFTESKLAVVLRLQSQNPESFPNLFWYELP